MTSWMQLKKIQQAQDILFCLQCFRKKRLSAKKTRKILIRLEVANNIQSSKVFGTYFKQVTARLRSEFWELQMDRVDGVRFILFAKQERLNLSRKKFAVICSPIRSLKHFRSISPSTNETLNVHIKTSCYYTPFTRAFTALNWRLLK